MEVSDADTSTIPRVVSYHNVVALGMLIRLPAHRFQPGGLKLLLDSKQGPRHWWMGLNKT